MYGGDVLVSLVQWNAENLSSRVLCTVTLFFVCFGSGILCVRKILSR